MSIRQTSDSLRASPLTVGAIAIVAYALCDMIHEALGHGVATLMSPGVHTTLLTTVALSAQGGGRAISAAGTLANLLISALLFVFLQTRRGSGSFRCFLWLLASLNLFNGVAYLLYSGILGAGDWAAVVAGLEPRLLIRAAMTLLGAALYALSVWWCARVASRLADQGTLRDDEIASVSRLSYGIGGLLFVAGAIADPISPTLILTSGVSSGFGAMAGLLFAPHWVRRSGRVSDGPSCLGLSRVWLVSAALIGTLFVFVIGREIALG